MHTKKTFSSLANLIFLRQHDAAKKIMSKFMFVSVRPGASVSGSEIINVHSTHSITDNFFMMLHANKFIVRNMFRW